MTMRNLMIAMMILIVLSAAVTAIVSAAKRPTVTVKVPYHTGTALAPTARTVPVVDPGGTLSAGTGEASADSWPGPAGAR